MTDSPDDFVTREHRAAVTKVARTLDKESGLAASLDVADYRRARGLFSGSLNVEAGLQIALNAMADEPRPVFRILGTTAITLNGRPNSEWAKPRERAVLAVLLLHANRPVTIGTILEWAWPDDVPRPVNVVTTMHTYMARLRRALRSVNASHQIRVHDGAYRLDTDRSTIDYHRFVMLRGEAQSALRQGDPHRAADKARRAIGLWQGRPLEDLRSDRAANWRHDVITCEWLPANITLLGALLELGDINEVVDRLDELHLQYPHDVELMKIRLEALYALDRVTEATAFYLHARRQLLENGNDRGTEHLRQFHNNLREGSTHPGAPAHAVGRLVPRQLPSDTLFVGRESSLAAIEAAFQADRQSHLITVEGAAGIGKTALAVRWAHSARHRFPDGDLFVNLNRFAERPDFTVSSVVDELLNAFGQPPAPTLGLPAKKLLTSQFLEGKRILVILDDARDTHHVRELIQLFTECLVIVTSRERLIMSTDGFIPYRVVVDPMTRAEVTALLLARVGDSQKILNDDRENLVRTAHGSPLMVSILAEHVLRYPAHRPMSKNLRLVEDASTPRQAESLFSLSYQALAAPDRRLFRLLALHPGPEFSLAAARAFADMTTNQTRSSLAALVTAHLLVHVDAPDRFRFHDIVHAFAARSAERDEEPVVRAAAEQRGLDHYTAAAAQADRWLRSDHVVSGFTITDAAEPVVFTNATQARSWFDQERENLVESLRAAGAHGHHRHALRLAAIITPLLDRYGHYEDSRSVHEVALTSARAVGDRNAEAATLVGLGTVHLVLGNLLEAYRFLTTGLRFVEDHGDPRGQAALLHQLGRLEMARDEPAAAISQYGKALDIVRDVDDLQGLCWTHCRLGEAHRALEQYDQAFVHLYRAEWFADRTGDQSALANCLFELGKVHRDLGDLPRAAEHYQRALLHLETSPTPDLGLTTRVHIAVSEVNLSRNALTAAMKAAQRTIELASQTYDNAAEARGHDLHGDVHAAYRDPPNAIVAWRRAADLYGRIGMSELATAILAKILAAPTELPDSSESLHDRRRRTSHRT